MMYSIRAWFKLFILAIWLKITEGHFQECIFPMQNPATSPLSESHLYYQKKDLKAKH